MADNPEAGDVTIGIGATIDQASLEETKAEFERQVNEMVEKIKTVMREGITLGPIKLPPGLDVGKLKAKLTPEALGIDPKVFEAAFSQLEKGMKEVEGSAQDMAEEGASAGEKVREGANEAEKAVSDIAEKEVEVTQKTADFDAQVNDLAQSLKDLVAGGMSLEGLKQNLTPEDVGVNTDVFNAAFAQVEKGMQEVGKASEQMASQTTTSAQSAGQGIADFDAKVQQLVVDIQGAMKSRQFSNFDTLKQAFTPEALGLDPAIVSSAFKQVEDGMKGVSSGTKDATVSIEQLSTKTVAALGTIGPQYDNFKEKVNTIKEAVRAFAEQSGASYDQIQKALAPNIATADRTAYTQAFKELGQEAKNAAGAIDGTGKSKDKFKANVISLGDVVRIVFGVTIGQMAVRALRSLVDQFKQAVQDGEEFLGTLFKLQVAIRALQRNGLDITMKEVNDEISLLLEKFPIFSRQALTEGVTNALLFTNNLKLTKEQIDEMIQSSITLSLVMGRDVNEVMRTMALTMSSGYSEGLQRLGISINRVVIAQKAMQLGFSGNYRTLTQNQIATAALALVVEQTNRMVEDAAKYQETWTGKLETGKAAAKNFWISWGERIAPAYSLFAETVGKMLKWIQDSMKYTDELRYHLILLAAQGFGMVIGSITAMINTFRNPGENPFETFLKYIDEFRDTVDKKVKNLVFPELSVELGNTKIGNLADVFGLTEEEANKVDEAAADLNTQLVDLAKKGAEDLAKIEQDKARDLEKIDQELYRDLLAAEQDYQRSLEKDAIDHERKLADIATKAARDQAKAGQDLARDLAKIEQDNAEAIYKAKLKYQQDSLHAEEVYQLKIKQMQEQYLFDLDEAIRSRNAKQALQITRRLKLEFGQAEDEHSLNIKQRQDDFQSEIAELEREKQIRIQQRQAEFQQRLADIAAQTAQEKADEQVRYQQELADEATRYAQKRADLQAKAVQDRADRIVEYQQQLRDLQQSQANQYKTIAEGLVKQYGLTGKMLDATYKLYLAYYGPNGALDQVYKYMVASAQNAATQVASALGKAGVRGGTPPLGTAGVNGFAEGGSFIASRPMNINVGEKGIEMVTVTPLSYLGRNSGKLLGPIPTGGQITPDHKVRLDILLSSDLEARIVSESLDQMSDILVSVEREGR